MTDASNLFRADSLWKRFVQDTRGMLGLVGSAFAWLIIIGPAGMLGWQCLTWLQHGYWDRWPISRALAGIRVYEPTASWAGIQQILGFLFQMPTSVALMFLGLGGMMLFGWLLLLLEKYQTADVRVSYDREGLKLVKVYRKVVTGSEEQVIRLLYRDIPDGNWRVTQIEWLKQA